MSEEKNTPINKGNYTDMEPPERIELFEKYRSEAWPEEYAQYRKNWSEHAQNKFIGEYPIQVDLELSNICNLSCPMCFRNKDGYLDRPNVKNMEYDLAIKILDEIGDKVPALRLSLRGESTLNPKLPAIVKYAKEKGIKEVSFLSNGFKMTEKYFEKLVEAGLDWLTISFDGMGETYNKVRAPLKFEDIYEKIQGMRRVKDRMQSNRPVVKIQSIWPAIKNNPQEFYNAFAPFVDQVAFNPLIDYLGNDEEDEIEFIENFCCPQLYQRLIIGATGTALMCTNDEDETEIVGDANIQSVHDIWHGASLKKIRSLHEKGEGHKCIGVCKHCFIPRKTSGEETTEINGQQVRIQNYTNRSQTIGE
jgi:sulfatase maturation enzyme AslB (radical SAM superfamily)